MSAREVKKRKPKTAHQAWDRIHSDFRALDFHGAVWPVVFVPAPKPSKKGKR